MIADVVYAAAWVFDISFATWVVARLWEAAADDGEPAPGHAANMQPPTR